MTSWKMSSTCCKLFLALHRHLSSTNSSRLVMQLTAKSRLWLLWLIWSNRSKLAYKRVVPTQRQNKLLLGKKIPSPCQTKITTRTRPKCSAEDCTTLSNHLKASWQTNLVLVILCLLKAQSKISFVLMLSVVRLKYTHWRHINQSPPRLLPVPVAPEAKLARVRNENETTARQTIITRKSNPMRSHRLRTILIIPATDPAAATTAKSRLIRRSRQYLLDSSNQF